MSISTRSSGFAWSVGGGFPTIDFLEVITHEIGHALGVGHILYADAIMQPYHHNRFSGPGTAYLLGPDILAIRSLYGSGVGSVQPMPEPSTMLLLATGLAVALLRRRHFRGPSCSETPPEPLDNRDIDRPAFRIPRIRDREVFSHDCGIEMRMRSGGVSPRLCETPPDLILIS